MCYGYRTTVEGGLIIYPVEAIYIFHIFERFAAGDSLGKISASLARMNVLSPTGKDIWSKETISKILKNEKYLGDVVLGKTNVINGVQVKSHDTSNQVHMRAHHPAIISHELFNAVQREKRKRAGTNSLRDELLGG